MADVNAWAAQIDAAVTQNAGDTSALKLAVLELMRDIYVEGMRDAQNRYEKHLLVAILVAGQLAYNRLQDVVAATNLAEQIMTVE